MTDQTTGPRCGNNPSTRLTDGDRKAVADFRAYLADRATLRDRIAAALDPLQGTVHHLPPTTRQAVADAMLAALPTLADRAAVYAQVAEAVRSMAAEHPGNASWVQDCHHIADRLDEAGAELRGAAGIRAAVLREAADRLEQANPDRGFEFSEGVDWTLDELRRLAAEAHDGEAAR